MPIFIQEGLTKYLEKLHRGRDERERYGKGNIRQNSLLAVVSILGLVNLTWNSLCIYIIRNEIN